MNKRPRFCSFRINKNRSKKKIDEHAHHHSSLIVLLTLPTFIRQSREFIFIPLQSRAHRISFRENRRHLCSHIQHQEFACVNTRVRLHGKYSTRLKFALRQQSCFNRNCDQKLSTSQWIQKFFTVIYLATMFQKNLFHFVKKK